MYYYIDLLPSWTLYETPWWKEPKLQVSMHLTVQRDMIPCMMIFRSTKHSQMCMNLSVLCSSSSRYSNSRWRVLTPRADTGAKSITCKARLGPYQRCHCSSFDGSYLVRWTDCFPVWWACSLLRLQVGRTSGMKNMDIQLDQSLNSVEEFHITCLGFF